MQPASTLSALALGASLAAMVAGCASAPHRQADPAAARVTPDSAARAPEPPYFEFQVETPAREQRGTCAPRLPEALRAPGSNGDAIAQFVVDTMGVPEPATFRIIRSSHEAWAAAVRDALPCMRYSPARIRGRRVRQLVQQPFVFDVMR